MLEPIRFGLIGLGRHGERYAAHLARGDIPGATLTAAWRRTEATEQCKSFGARYESNVDVLIRAEDVDALIVVVPAGLHAEMAKKVAAKKKPLLLEKPMARTAAEAEQIAAAFGSLPLMIAQTLRFDPLTEALRTARAEFGRLTGFGLEQRLENRGLAWEDEPTASGGGVLIQTAIHTVDALRVVTGSEFDLVTASVQRVFYEHNEDVALLHLRSRDDPAVIGDVRASKIGRSRHMRFSLFFEDGGLEADYIDRALYVTRGRDRSARPVPDQPTVPLTLQAFVAHLRGGPNPVPAEDALGTMRLVQAAYDYVR